MATEYPTSDEWAASMSEVLIKPLREVGTLLAAEVDRLNVEVAALREDTAELGRILEALSRAMNERGYLHSVKVPE